ncbi:MAG TPA: filamentous hemagglutinin N-terminal domain-containing protein [Crinalium sp.]
MSQFTWTVTSSVVGAWLWVQPSLAQVIPDDTLPVGERSQVTGDPDFQIDGGAQRGGNLFHSFSQFSVPTGGSAFFNNAANVQTIFSRVTGGSISNIDGVIRANGTANLFLLNPNGILFGPNASLNIGGSFAATTARAIGFSNGEVFSSDPTQPLPSQLLTVNPNALFFNQTPQPIVNQSTFNGSGLQVPLRQNLLLVGGSVQFDNGRVASPGSYVEVGSVGGIGTVGLTTISPDWQLTIPDGVARADVSLLNDSRINVLAAEGGSVAIAARNLSLNRRSRVRVGIESDEGFADAQTGGIQIDVTDTINLETRATLRIEVLPGGQGHVGDMTLNTGSLVLTGGSQLVAAVGGQGTVGRVTINARDRVFFDQGSNVFGIVEDTGIGNTGGIFVTTGSLVLAGGAQLIFNSKGQGNAGSVTINARDRVSVEGEASDGAFASTIFTQVNPGAVAQGGDITITTGTLSLLNGGALNSANAGGTGNAGRVTIHARDAVQIRGTAPLLPINRSGIFTSATEGSTGNGGDVSITTGSLSVSDQGRIITNAEAQGRAGNIQIQARDAVTLDGGDTISALDVGAVGRGGDIDITARSLSVTHGAQLSTSTRGQGDAGNVTVTARDAVSLDGANPISPSAIITRAEAGAIGNGGQIGITAGSVSLTNGAQLATTTFNQGRAGDIVINASNRVAISGTDPNYANRTPQLGDEISAIRAGSASGLYANTEANSIGGGGNIRVTTGQLTIDRGGRLVASTAGQGNAGNIRVRAARGVMLSGLNPDGSSSGLLTNTENTATGQGGEIRVDTDALRVNGGAVLSARSTSTARGGEIRVNANTVDLTRGGQLLTTAFSSGQAGNITVYASDRLRIVGQDATFTARLAQLGGAAVDPVSAASGLFTNTEMNSSGAGGAIALTTNALSLLNGGRLVASTAGQGRAGDITLRSSNLRLAGALSGLFAQTSTAADAGNLTIQPRTGSRVTVQLQRGAQISAATTNSGRGGTLTITAPEAITLTGNGSIIAAGTGGQGTGGNLTLRTRNLNIQNRAEVTVSSSSTGRAGSLFVDADRIFLNHHGRIRADTSGGGGDMNLRSPLILLRNGSNITTNATGRSIPGGDMALSTRFLIAVPREDSNISANSENFRGGNIDINASAIFGLQPRLRLTPLSDITATGANAALDGTIAITITGIDPTSGLVELPVDVEDSSRLIARGCAADQGNSFIVSGRGGLPPNPEAQLDDDAGWQDRRRLTVTQQTAIPASDPSVSSTMSSAAPTAMLLEATGWQTSATGEVTLVATASDPVAPSAFTQTPTCPGRL